MILLNIVTAVSRPYNIKVITENIRSVITKCEVRWYLIVDNLKVDKFVAPKDCYYYDSIPGDISGAPQKNKALDLIDSGWVYFLDDDNLMHEQYEECFLEKIKTKRLIYKNGIQQQGLIQGVVFNQLLADGSLRLGVDRKNGSAVDCGQFTVEREIIGDQRFNLDFYASDGVFFQEIYNRHKEKIIFVDEPFTYYNGIRSGK
jgi:hypothetical protein